MATPSKPKPAADGETNVRHNAQDRRQDGQDARSDEQDARADRSDRRQDKQDARGDRAAIVNAEGRLHDFEMLAGGVAALSLNVSGLQDAVQEKNTNDRRTLLALIGNGILLFALIFVLALLYKELRVERVVIEGNQRIIKNEAAARANEALRARRQLSDCQLPPGEVLEDGYVNPGVCFVESNRRTKAFIDDATAQIQADTRALLDAQAAAIADNAALRADVREAARTQQRALDGPTRSPPTTAPSGASRTTTVTTVSRPSPVPTEPPPAEPLAPRDDGLICTLLRLLGGC